MDKIVLAMHMLKCFSFWGTKCVRPLSGLCIYLVTQAGCIAAGVHGYSVQ